MSCRIVQLASAGVAAVALACVFAPATQAAIVHQKFGAQIYNMGPGTLPARYAGLQNGHTFTVEFDLDLAAPDSNWRTFYGEYPTAVTNVTLSFPSISLIDHLGSAQLNISDGSTEFQEDSIRFDINHMGPEATFTFWLRNKPPTAITNDRIPSVIIPENWNYLHAASMFTPNGQNPTIFSGGLYTLPEPGALSLLALAAPAILRRRRRA